tara:strand:+ start:9572 stop:9865 length:294 start_codon:yes stop_codon:yes gene_type:complete
MIQLKVSKSDKKEKKLKAVFTYPDGKTKTTHFGAAGMTDYLQSKDKERRKRYRSRHKKDLRTNDFTRAGYLSYYILWGDKTNLKDAIKDYKKRFNLV